MRARYEALIREAKQRGETQETIAERAGLRQNVISKMLYNDKLGPQVETFVKAVEGLGLPVSVFFAQIEGAASGTDTAKPSVTQPTQAVADEPLSPSSEDLEQAWDAIGTLARIAERERERADRAHHRSDSSTHVAGEAERPPHRVRSRPRPRKRKPTGRRER